MKTEQQQQQQQTEDARAKALSSAKAEVEAYEDCHRSEAVEIGFLAGYAAARSWREIKSVSDIPHIIDRWNPVLFRRRDDGGYDLRDEVFAYTGRNGMADVYSHWQKIEPPTEEQDAK